jgi:hypothetical protein
LDKTRSETTGEVALTVRETQPPPLIDWGVAIGDVIHELRSALDQMVCVLVKAKDPNHRCRDSAYPIVNTEEAWNKSGLSRLAGTDNWTRIAIRSQQPFSDDPSKRGLNPLWLLRELSNIDKHRSIHVGSFFLYPPEVEFDPPECGEVTFVRPGGDFSAGDVVLRYRTRPARPTNPRLEGSVLRWDQPEVRRNVTLGAEVVFRPESPAGGMKVSVLLDWLIRHVEWIIVTFGYKYFNGPSPEGLQRVTVPVSNWAVVEESPEDPAD